jgi:hypothetical protein
MVIKEGKQEKRSGRRGKEGEKKERSTLKKRFQRSVVAACHDRVRTKRMILFLIILYDAWHWQALSTGVGRKTNDRRNGAFDDFKKDDGAR